MSVALEIAAMCAKTATTQTAPAVKNAQPPSAIVLNALMTLLALPAPIIPVSMLKGIVLNAAKLLLIA